MRLVVCRYTEDFDQTNVHDGINLGFVSWTKTRQAKANTALSICSSSEGLSACSLQLALQFARLCHQPNAGRFAMDGDEPYCFFLSKARYPS
jgi:hypothetical protein